jgi:hypothetical protein
VTDKEALDLPIIINTFPQRRFWRRKQNSGFLELEIIEVNMEKLILKFQVPLAIFSTLIAILSMNFNIKI